MVKRFLRYSLDHNRPVKALFASALRYRNITVTALDDQEVTYRVAGKKAPVVSPLGDILSVCYARGDDGDTLQYVGKEQENDLNSGEMESEDPGDPA